MSFTILALQGFGGVMAVAQRELVEKKRWLTKEQFLEEWAVAQVMPGPNVVNLSLMIGGSYFGLAGALAALAGMLVVPLAVLLLLALVYAEYGHHAAVANALRGMAAVAAGMIIATGMKMSSALRTHALGPVIAIALCAIVFVAIALLRWPLVYVLFGVGGLSCLLTYLRLK